MIGRRGVLTSVCATLVCRPAWPQAGQTLPRLALIEQGEPVTVMIEGGHPWWDALLRELGGLGLVEGRTILIERWTVAGIGEPELPDFAAQVVASQPDVILARGIRLISIMKAATTTIPIVGIGASLVGLVDSIARPGGNLTGIDPTGGTSIYRKQLEFLRAVVPQAPAVAWLGPADFWEGPIGRTTRQEADALGIQLAPFLVEVPISDATIGQAFTEIEARRFAALYVSAASDLAAHSRLIAELALAARLPAVAMQRQFAEAGLIMAYGADFPDLYRRAAHYVDQILKGADPAELPIESPTKFEFIVNLRTAAALGTTLPAEILPLATEIVD